MNSMFSSSKTIALLISLIIGTALVVVFARDLAKTSLTFNDEYLSLERSQGFIKFNDWMHVYSGHRPSYKKPPLQYWLNAINLNLNIPEFLAFRLWSYLFFLGSIMATSLCAAYLCRENPWVLPASMLLVAGSRELIVAGRSAMLDSGHCFFLMASLLCFLYAKENARWWIVCGLMAGLGALQKSPIAIFFVAIMLYTFNLRGDKHYLWQNLRQISQFKSGTYLALFLLFSWPLLQIALDGSDYLKTAIHEQILRFSPIGEERFARGNFFQWIRWLRKDISITGILAVVCTPLMLFVRKWRSDNYVVALIVFILITIIAFSFGAADGKLHLHSRYIVILSPFLIIIFVRFVNDVLPWKPAILIITVLITVLSVPRVQAAIDRSTNAEDSDTFNKARTWIGILDNVRQPTDVLIIDGTLFPFGAYGYFGKSTKPFHYLDWKIISKSKLEVLSNDRFKNKLSNIDNPVLGISSLENIDLVDAIAPTYDVLYRDAEIFIWRRPTQQ